MSKCLICGSEIPAERSNCPCCGEYPVHIIGENTQETQSRLNRHAEEKRKQKLKNISIELQVFRMDGQKLAAQELSVGEAAQLYHHEIWLQEAFAPACGLPSMDINCIISANDTQKKLTCRVEVPAGDGLLYLGAVLEDGFQLYLLIKNQDDIIRSQPISIIQ